MKVKSVAIQNYRGYKDIEKITFDDLTLIVGKNDIGKSTILEALDVFFGNRKPDRHDLNINCDKEKDKIIISVEFSDIPDIIDLDEGAKTDLASEYLLNQEGYLEIKKVFNPNSPSVQPKIYIVANYPSRQENLLVLKNSDLKKLAIDLKIDKSIYVASINNSIRKAIWASQEITLESQDVEIDKEDGKAIYTKIEEEMPLYSLFSVDRKNSDQDSEVQDPIKNSVKQIIKELSPKLEPIKQEILKKLDEIAIGTIEKLKEMNPEVAQALKPITENPAWEKAFSITIESDGVPLNKRGSGVKRLVLINFFRNEAERIKKEKQKKSIIYAIEEPETSQHPDWQIKLFDALNSLVEDGNIQVILTSHHPELAGLVKLENIRLIKKDLNGVTIENGSDTNYQEIAKTLGILPRIDGVRVVVCLEGPHDITFMKNISSIFGIDKDDERILWVPLGGAILRDYVTERYLIKLKIPQVHYYDRDDDEKYKQYIEQLVKDGHWGKLSDFLALESYLHPSLYKKIWPNLQGNFVDLANNSWLPTWKDKNICQELSAFIKAEYDSGNRELLHYGSSAIKKQLSTNAHEMTIDLFKDINAFDELNLFFGAIKDKLLT